MRTLSTILLLIFTVLQPALAQDKIRINFHSDFEQAAFSKPDLDPFELLLSPDPEMTLNKYTRIQDQFSEIMSKAFDLKEKSKSEVQFLERLFYTIHRKNLSWYENYVTFGDLIEHKKYDCLTGTALLALVMNELDIKHQILEFDFHIFLMAEVAHQMVLMEATDPMNGFVSEADQIHARIEEAYNSAGVSDEFNKTGIMNKIDLVDLAGLQYYNLAVDQFNRGNYSHAREFIKKADILYPSERIKNTASLIATSSL
ncbi:hypothetical protein [Marinoscillum sp. MHG1-6]|uniref:hypothetical protein n=1 Tax=Marinoscillum sp. MHG1-6 TaxID=2959627 RepID=UPI002157E3B8|nr:hypothetical protein [Marinoscillum sp. MHG1-6]